MVIENVNDEGDFDPNDPAFDPGVTPPWVNEEQPETPEEPSDNNVETAVPVANQDLSPKVYAEQHEANSLASSSTSNPGDILPDGATAEEVAQNTALFGQQTQSVDKPMNIKTTGKENKKIVLGFGLNGYKSILDTSPSTSGIPNQYGIGLSDDEICWLISVFHIYENGTRRVGSEWNSL